MATIQKRGDSYLAQIRRAKMPSISRSFPSKKLAQAWVTKTERELDEQKFQDVRPIANITVADIIERYNAEIGGSKGFGENKTNVLKSINTALGSVKLPELTPSRMTEYVNSRLKAGAGGVTIGIDLSYLKTVLKVAAELWNIRADLTGIGAARAGLGYKGISTKSNERERRPTPLEIDNLCTSFDTARGQQIPMSDIIHFAIETAMRLGEITRIKWGDLNIEDRTIIIRDRKHPTKKDGNDQIVPLLGKAFEILMRQPKNPNDTRIFPFNGNTISCIFPRAVQRLGIDDLHFHDLRHEGISRLFEQKYQIEQVAIVSGHRDWSMLRRYVQLKAKDLHRD